MARPIEPTPALDVKNSEIFHAKMLNSERSKSRTVSMSKVNDAIKKFGATRGE